MCLLGAAKAWAVAILGLSARLRCCVCGLLVHVYEIAETL